MSNSWLKEVQGVKPKHSGSRAHVCGHSKLESAINRSQYFYIHMSPAFIKPSLLILVTAKDTGRSLLPELSEYSSHFLAPKSWILRSAGLGLFCPPNWMHLNMFWGGRRLARKSFCPLPPQQQDLHIPLHLVALASSWRNHYSYSFAHLNPCSLPSSMIPCGAEGRALFQGTQIPTPSQGDYLSSQVGWHIPVLVRVTAKPPEPSTGHGF